MYPNIHCSTIYNNQDMKNNLRYPLTDEWIENHVVIYAMEYIQWLYKKKIVLFVEMWMDLESVRQSEVVRKKKSYINIYTLKFLIVLDDRIHKSRWLESWFPSPLPLCADSCSLCPHMVIVHAGLTPWCLFPCICLLFIRLHVTYN